MCDGRFQEVPATVQLVEHVQVGPLLVRFDQLEVRVQVAVVLLCSRDEFDQVVDAFAEFRERDALVWGRSEDPEDARPEFVADERDGFRQFYPVPDRIQLADGSYAAVRATQPTARYGESARARADRVLTWREAPGDDDPSLVLDVNRQSTVTLDSVASLTSPGPTSVFPYRYTRRDGSFRVLHGDDEVGRFASVGAMRERGYQPVPVPLVPEHHLRWGTPTLGLAVVDGEQVHYERITKQEQ